MTKVAQPGGTSGPTALDLDLLLAGGPAGPTSGPSMGFTTPSQPQMSPQGLLDTAEHPNCMLCTTVLQSVHL